MGDPLVLRVQSFVEIAIALNTLSLSQSLENMPNPLPTMKLSSELSNFFTGANPTDDMQPFLAGALNCLGALSDGIVAIAERG